LESHEIFACDISEERRDLIRKRYNINMHSKIEMVTEGAETVFLAVKPQGLREVLEDVSLRLNRHHLIISIAAGKTTGFIESFIGDARVVRVMPNLPCRVSEGMSVFCRGKRATDSDARNVSKLLGCFGAVREMREAHFDAVTALSGSGPAFFAALLEMMVAGAVEEGMDRKDALVLACQTMLGTSRLLIDEGIDPQDLITSVTSAKGTTAAGMEIMQGSGVAETLKRTIAAAAVRSRELSE
jgi:pyrroline-5-carboxylate reductase